MKFTKKIMASILVLALVIGTMTGVSAAVVDATNTVPNKKSLEKLVDEFSLPVGVIEYNEMSAGFTRTYSFAAKGKKGTTARAEMLKYKGEKKKEIKKASKRMFGKKTSKVTPFPGDMGVIPTLVITSIKKTTNKKYYVKGKVSAVDSNDKKRHECGTFKLYVQRKSTAKYKYVATKLFLSTWKQATTKSRTVDLFKSAKKYHNITAKMTYQLITVSGVGGAKAINKVLKADMNGFQNSQNSKNFYTWVATDDSKKVKDTYYWQAFAKVKYNMNNILSIRITTRGYAGDEDNTNEYGYNFNIKTGKQIGIKNVVSGSTKSIKKKMYAAINKTKWKKSYKKKAKKIIKKTKLSKLEFYLKNDKVLFSFEPHSLGKKQTSFKRFYIFSKYF